MGGRPPFRAGIRRMRYSRIVSTGISLPDKVVTNDDIARMVDTTDEWIFARTGIRERRVGKPEEVTSDFAAIAGKQALDRAGMQPEEVEAIIVATITPDLPYPATACLAQTKLGAKNAFAFDVSAACTGYVYALSIADAYIRSGQCENVLVIGADMMARTLNWKDRGSCILFADGAGATLVRASDEPGVRYTELGSDGEHAELIYIPAGGTRTPASHDTVAQDLHYTVLDGREVYKLAVRYAEQLTTSALEKNGLSPDDVDLLVPHQANQRITDAVQERLGIAKEKVVSNIEKYGNTSAATIPLCLDDAIRDGRLKKGDLVLMVAFGAGFTWGVSLVDW